MQQEFINNLIRSIDTVSNEISDLLHHEDVFQNRVKTQVKNVDPYVLELISQSHYSFVLSAIRRQLGTDNSEISLMNILIKLKQNCLVITEQWYAETWLKDSSLLTSAEDQTVKIFVENIPHSEFKEHFGINGHLDASIVESDIEKLRVTTEKIKLYVDRRIAHRDRNVPDSIETAAYLEALNTLDLIATKYILLLKQIGITLKPVIQ